jgi:hypothetical protein
LALLHGRVQIHANKPAAQLSGARLARRHPQQAPQLLGGPGAAPWPAAGCRPAAPHPVGVRLRGARAEAQCAQERDAGGERSLGGGRLRGGGQRRGRGGRQREGSPKGSRVCGPAGSGHWQASAGVVFRRQEEIWVRDLRCRCGLLDAGAVGAAARAGARAGCPRRGRRAG